MMNEYMMGHSMGAGHFLWMLVIAIALVIPAWRLCQRIGYPGWIGILVLIPILNLALLYFIAFSHWPVNKSGEDKP
ncbi:hypothetical protein [Halopseudomonas salegens]|uniref:DUF805 domain-containing protein n=1 Tax=Halopseudomonas salegens TaxID=1434072 RepID=A0A1H2DYG6_9GAMM|nr:hypothetical protein [Halopseudomonas salegens]SDT87926.1 hypothetical protein SAMN05216210_0109 [Halopseudomonas salegens]